jgi:hypothetical protein
LTADALLTIIAGRDTTGLYEVRCRDPRAGHIAAREWFPLDQRAACLRFIAAKSAQLDVWIGGALRIERGAGGKANIRHTWALWIDCDEDKSAGCVERLMAFTPAPTMIIRSGSNANCHGWWALTEPVTEWWAERAMERLRYHLAPTGDKCSNLDRIMRPPGTLNWKGGDPTPVEAESFGGSPVTLSSLMKNLPDPPGNPPVRVRPRSDFHSNGPLDSVSSEHYYAALTGWEPSLTTHVRCPFWDHKSNPAMMLYDGGTWYCFACAEGGSIYEMAAHLWSYSLPVRGADFVALKERLTHALGGQ